GWCALVTGAGTREGAACEADEERHDGGEVRKAKKDRQRGGTGGGRGRDQPGRRRRALRGDADRRTDSRWRETAGDEVVGHPHGGGPPAHADSGWGGRRERANFVLAGLRLRPQP